MALGRLTAVQLSATALALKPGPAALSDFNEEVTRQAFIPSFDATTSRFTIVAALIWPSLDGNRQRESLIRFCGRSLIVGRRLVGHIDGGLTAYRQEGFFLLDLG